MNPGMNMNSMGGMGINMNGMNMGGMNPGMSHHPGMSGMMSNQPGMGGGAQHPSQHGMSGMNSMMGMGMGMPQGGNAPNNLGGGPVNPSMGGGMGHNSMQHLGHQQGHLGQPSHGSGGGPHHMMNTMNSMQHGGMNHPMGSMPNMNGGANSMLGGMHPSNSMPGYPPTNNGLSYGNPMAPPPSNIPASGQSIAHIEWRAQFTRDQRASLIAKVYHEMVRVSTEPPGIALWINVAWFELTLFKECQTREDYINQIIKRLQQLKTQGGDMPNGQGGRHPGMPGGHLPNGGMQHPQQPHNPSAPYNMYSNPNGPNPLTINPGNGQIQHNHPNGGFQSQQTSGQNSTAATPKQGKPSNNNPNNKHQPATNANSSGAPKNLNRTLSSGSMMPSSAPPSQGPSASQPNHPQHQQSPETMVNTLAGNNPAEYWRQHGMLKAKYLNDVSTVHSAFKKYVDHMKPESESDQKQKLSYLLAYVHLCATVLDEDASTHPPRTLEELEKINKYVVRIVLPYLKKLKTEKDRRTSGGSNTPQGGVPSSGQPNNPNANNMGGGFEAMMGMRPGSAPQQSSMQQGQSMQQQQQNHFQSMMQAPVPKPLQQPNGGNMQQSSSGLMLDDGGYNMGGGGPASMHPGHSNNNSNPMGQYYGSNQPNMNSMGFMGSGYGGGGGMGGNDDMMTSLGQGSNDMNFLDMDGSSFGMGDAGATGQGGGSSGEDGDGGDLMNIVEAL